MLRFEPFLSLLLALFAGLLIGLERQQNAASDTSGPEILGGVRTHPLVAIVGACTMLLARQVGPGILLVSLGGFLASSLNRVGNPFCC